MPVKERYTTEVRNQENDLTLEDNVLESKNSVFEFDSISPIKSDFVTKVSNFVPIVKDYIDYLNEFGIDSFGKYDSNIALGNIEAI